MDYKKYFSLYNSDKYFGIKLFIINEFSLATYTINYNNISYCKQNVLVLMDIDTLTAVSAIIYTILLNWTKFLLNLLKFDKLQNSWISLKKGK